MDDLEKISKVEYALRSERDRLRKEGGPDNIKGANALNTYLQNADTASKLRFADILIGAKEATDDAVVRLRQSK
jgi:hypothetical protein